MQAGRAVPVYTAGIFGSSEGESQFQSKPCPTNMGCLTLRSISCRCLLGRGSCTTPGEREMRLQNPVKWEEKRRFCFILRLPNKHYTPAACLQTHGLWSATSPGCFGVRGDRVLCAEQLQLQPSPRPIETPQSLEPSIT